LERNLGLIDYIARKDLFLFEAPTDHTAELATAKHLVDFFLKWMWVFLNMKAKN
jgi:hypothetical protein